MKRRDFAAFALTALALPAWAKPAAKPSAFAALADRFLEALWQLDPDAAVAAGRFEFASRLTLPSAAQRQVQGVHRVGTVQHDARYVRVTLEQDIGLTQEGPSSLRARAPRTGDGV